MNLSLNSKTLLFAPFSASFKAASWPTYGRTPPSKGGDSSRFKEAGRLKTPSAPMIDSSPWLAPEGTRLRRTDRSSMPCEAALKAAKKSIKNQNFRIKG